MKRTIISILGLILVSSMAIFAQDGNTVNAGLSSGYLIRPGDKVSGSVMGESEFNFQAIIDDNGKFELPYVNKEIVAKCRTAKDVKNDVIEYYSRFLKEPLVDVQVERRPATPITVSGEVKSPRQIELKYIRDVRLLEMLRVAGGAKDSAGGIVRVFRTQLPACASEEQVKTWKEEYDNGQVFPSQTYSLKNINTASVESNPVIYPGDIIYLEKANPVYFTGEINSAQAIYIKENGLTLSQAIAMLGGTRIKAKTKDIKIYRKKENAPLGREIISVNYDLIKKGEAKDVWLQPYDIIDIELKKDSMAKTILKVLAGVGRTAATSIATNVPRTIAY